MNKTKILIAMEIENQPGGLLITLVS